MLERRDLLGAATLAALLLAPAACGGGDKPGAAQRTEAASGQDQAQNEATQLGAEITNVLDRVLAYASARSGKAPATIAEVGMDSLTPKVVRRVSRQGLDILVTAAFRRPAGRAVTECHGTNRALEELSLMGHYELTCSVAGGGIRTFTIEPGSTTAQ